eukprot:5167-Heterococcus_DN1.PRE.2
MSVCRRGLLLSAALCSPTSSDMIAIAPCLLLLADAERTDSGVHNKVLSAQWLQTWLFRTRCNGIVAICCCVPSRTRMSTGTSRAAATPVFAYAVQQF